MSTSGIKKVVLHSDIILAHLMTSKKEVSVMRMAMRKYFCYTTVFNAIELFSLVRSEQEKKTMESAMSSLKILGLNAKSAPSYADVIQNKRLPRMNGLIAGLCLESKLPILTSKPSEFRRVKGLRVLTPNDIVNDNQ